MSTDVIAVCVDWVDLHPEIDPLTGAVSTDARRGGFSDSDRAALEVALTAAAAQPAEVVVISVAPALADGALVELAASGADRAIRIDGDAALRPADVARAIAEVIGTLGNLRLVVCGDAGATWGTGAVPGYLAHLLGAAQVLGVVELPNLEAAGGPLETVRRLDGGRREVVTIDGPAVISVEGAVARLRRASLGSVMSWRRCGVEVLGHATATPSALVAEITASIRPRARAFAAPAGERALDRIVNLTGALVERTPPRTVEAEPAEAAQVIVDQLRSWGYLDGA